MNLYRIARALPALGMALIVTAPASVSAFDIGGLLQVPDGFAVPAQPWQGPIPPANAPAPTVDLTGLFPPPLAAYTDQATVGADVLLEPNFHTKNLDDQVNAAVRVENWAYNCAFSPNAAASKIDVAHIQPPDPGVGVGGCTSRAIDGYLNMTNGYLNHLPTVGGGGCGEAGCAPAHWTLPVVIDGSRLSDRYIAEKLIGVVQASGAPSATKAASALDLLRRTAAVAILDNLLARDGAQAFPVSTAQAQDFARQQLAAVNGGGPDHQVVSPAMLRTYQRMMAAGALRASIVGHATRGQRSALLGAWLRGALARHTVDVHDLGTFDLATALPADI